MLKNTSAEAVLSREKRIVTNDIFFAAFLLCKKLKLLEVLRNERHRVSFVLAGNGAKELRQAYFGGSVFLDVRSFREKLTHVRKIMDGEQRSVAHVSLQYAGNREPQDHR